MCYIVTNNETAALDNLLHTQDSNPIKNTVSPTPSKKAKYTPVTNLDSDLETEATGKQSVKEGYGVPITNHSGFVFEWKDIKQKCKKVTAVVTLPSGVDPANVSNKLEEPMSKNTAKQDCCARHYMGASKQLWQ